MSCHIHTEPFCGAIQCFVLTCVGKSAGLWLTPAITAQANCSKLIGWLQTCGMRPELPLHLIEQTWLRYLTSKGSGDKKRCMKTQTDCENLTPAASDTYILILFLHYALIYRLVFPPLL